MRRHSPYNYAFNNPIRFIDPDGMSPASTHTDLYGNVVAVYDDGDLGVYEHMDLPKTFATNDSDAKNGMKKLTSKDGTKMGTTLHTYSFADFDEFENGVVKPVGRISFGSHWAADKVKEVIDETSGVFDYALNAGTHGDYDIKSKTPKGEGFYYGSKIFDNVYASARDAGNVAAGVVASKSIFGSKMIEYGFGAYNAAGNSKIDAISTMSYDLLIRGTGGRAGYLQRPTYGEDVLTSRGIKWGIKNANKFK